MSLRELQILLKLAVGHKEGEIAEVLSLSVETVTLYRHRITRKLGLTTNSDITYFAVKRGLLD